MPLLQGQDAQYNPPFQGSRPETRNLSPKHGPPNLSQPSPQINLYWSNLDLDSNAFSFPQKTYEKASTN